MKRPKIPESFVWRKYILAIGLSVVIVFLMFYKLGSLTTGVSSGEIATNIQPLGWHGLFRQPLYLPINLFRSIFFKLFNHSVFLLRLPSVLFGIASIASFSGLVYLWHGKKVAYLSTLMFVCSAWLLHVSRLATNDVVYLWAIVSAMLGYVCLDEFEHSKAVAFLNFFLLGLLITIPGLVWLSLFMLFIERKMLKDRLDELNLWGRLLSIILLLLWLPLTIYRNHVNHTFKIWLGLPNHFGSLIHIFKNFVAVPVHLLIRGPAYPQLWLGRSAVLDAFALAMLILGAYTYVKHRNNSRTRLLAALLLLSIILIGLNGSVSFSLIIPLAYLLIAMGLSYLMHSWKKVFPLNPVARWLSVSIIIVAILFSCLYNLRSYFIAWPHDPNTYSTFDRTV